METVARFHKIEDAYLFRSFLESEGIPAHVFDEHISQLFWHYTLATGGIRVAVADEDLTEAERMYVEYESRITAGPAVVGDVKFWPVVLLATIALGAPFMIFGRKPPKVDSGNP